MCQVFSAALDSQFRIQRLIHIELNIWPRPKVFEFRELAIAQTRLHAAVIHGATLNIKQASISG